MKRIGSIILSIGILANFASFVIPFQSNASDSATLADETEINSLNAKRQIADKAVKEYLSNSKVLQPDELPDTIRDKYIVIELGREDNDALEKLSTAFSQADLNYRNCKFMPQDTDDIDSELNKIRKELFFFVLENNLPADFYEIGTVQNMDDHIVMEYYYKDQIVPDMIYKFMDDHNYDRELIYFSVAESEDDSKKSLNDTASTYGADTDYLNIPNYYYNPEVNTGTITGYSYESIIPVKDYTALANGAAKYSDASFGISVLEVLAHNGLISAGDIKKDADKLNTIGDSEELRKLITDYQSLLGKTEFGMAKNYSFKSKSSKEKIPELVSIAEKASKDKKYFLIMYGSYNTKPTELEKSMGFTDGSNVTKAHSAVGIGITTGSWTFDGKTYDKCILTLDSVNVNKDSGAFSDNTCIYINSSTNDYYVPAYSGNAESDLHIVAIDDDKLLNFGGAISPADKFDTDISDIINVTMTNKNTTALYEITAYSGEKSSVLNKENDYLDNYHNPYNGNLFIKANSVSISRQSESNVDEITLSNNDSYAQIELKKADSIVDFDGKTYKLQYKEDKEDSARSVLDYGLSLNSKDGSWSFYGNTSSSVSFTPSKNGVVITGKNDSLSVDLPVGDKSVKSNFFVSGSVLVNADKNGNISFMIDKNNDGEFESAAIKGDVDCDGKVDAADASLVLADYNNASVGAETILNRSLADYNEDGKIDADDATQILIEYSRLSTT